MLDEPFRKMTIEDVLKFKINYRKYSTLYKYRINNSKEIRKRLFEFTYDLVRQRERERERKHTLLQVPIVEWKLSHFCASFQRYQEEKAASEKGGIVLRWN